MASAAYTFLRLLPTRLITLRTGSALRYAAAVCFTLFFLLSAISSLLRIK